MAGTEVEIAVDPAADAPPPDRAGDWFGVGAALLMFAAAAWFAARRSRAQGEVRPRRLVRIAYAAGFFAAAFTALLVLDELTDPGSTVALLPSAALSALVFLGVGAVLFGIADFWLGLAGPRRTPRWLAGAVAVFAAVAALCLAVPHWLRGEPVPLLRPDLLKMILATAAASIGWWAWLPAPNEDVSRRFE